MNKTEILKQLIKALESNLDILIQSAHDAKEAATHEDSKAENKYDTRGLEASYLAGAQAKRATELQITIEVLTNLELLSFKAEDKLDMTALVETELESGDRRWFFILPKAGGERVVLAEQTIHTLTPHSPLGKLLIGKIVGDEVELKLNDSDVIYNILSAY